MTNGRANNGGHSTKSNKPTDKRKNANKRLLDKYIAEDFDYEKMSKLMQKLYNDAMAGDVKSAALFLGYVLGKPKETKDIIVSEAKNLPSWMDE